MIAPLVNISFCHHMLRACLIFGTCFTAVSWAQDENTTIPVASTPPDLSTTTQSVASVEAILSTGTLDAGKVASPADLASQQAPADEHAALANAEPTGSENTASQGLADAADATTRTLTEGVQVRDLVIGQGVEASSTATQVLHFRLWLANGPLISSTYDKMYPVPFELIRGAGGAIKGMEIGTEGMRVGGKRVIVIPPEAAYGSRGGEKIPPESTLIYEVELVDVV